MAEYLPASSRSEILHLRERKGLYPLRACLTDFFRRPASLASILLARTLCYSTPSFSPHPSLCHYHRPYSTRSSPTSPLGQPPNRAHSTSISKPRSSQRPKLVKSWTATSMCALMRLGPFVRMSTRVGIARLRRANWPVSASPALYGQSGRSRSRLR
jgi:hypothetical protein